MQKWLLPQFTFNLVELILLAACLLCIVLYIINYSRKLYKIRKFNKNYKLDKTQAIMPPLSVIIVAYNEFNNLPNLIDQLINQNYPNYEIILINDGSTDGTDAWATQLALSNTKFKYTYLNPDYFKKSGKKIGLTLGIKKALYPNLVLIDGDCQVSSNQFLLHYGNAFASNYNLIIGVSPHKYNSSLLNAIIKTETLQTAFSYLSATLLNKPYMAVGRNFGYTKELYNSVNGFENHYHIPCGDDDLFVQDVRKNANATILIHKDVQTTSLPSKNWKQYLRTKVRHLYAGKFYSLSSKLFIAYPLILQVIFLSLLIAFSIISAKWLIPLILFILMLLYKSILQIIAFKIIYKSRYKSFYLLLSPLFLIVQIINIINHYFSKTIKWKHN